MVVVVHRLDTLGLTVTRRLARTVPTTQRIFTEAVGPMSGYVVLAAVCAAGAVGNLTWQVLSPRRAPERRMAPYFEVARSRLGGPVGSFPEPVFMGEATAGPRPARPQRHRPSGPGPADEEPRGPRPPAPPGRRHLRRPGLPALDPVLVSRGTGGPRPRGCAPGLHVPGRLLLLGSLLGPGACPHLRVAETPPRASGYAATCPPSP